MFKNITKISGISSKIGNIARVTRSTTVLAAAVAATGLVLASSGKAADITSVVTTLSTGPNSTTPHVAGWPEGTTGGYTFAPTSPATNYNISYGGQDAKLTSITAGSKTYAVSPTIGTTTFRTYSGLPNVNSLWQEGGGSGGKSVSVPLKGPDYTTANAAFSGNNFLIGADNVFATKPPTNESNDQGNIARIDVLFTGGITASAATAFAVFDRGFTGSHDAFGIAAIIEQSGGVPTAYAPLVTTYDSTGSWGNTNLLSSNASEDILRSTAGGTMHPATQVAQNIGGVLIPTNSLVAAGTTIYGYSLFSESVTGATNLVNYSSFPTADDMVAGGLDPTATTGLLYTTAVPEPATASLIGLGAAGLLARRPKRKLA